MDTFLFHCPPQIVQQRPALTSCIVITLTILIIIISSLFSTIFKPKPPKLTITSVQLPTFSTTVDYSIVNYMTFSQFLTARNPNRASVFTHYNCSLKLLYAGNQVGSMFIPPGKIAAGETRYMAATFPVQSFPLNGSTTSSIELESRLDMAGRVRVLHFFKHHVVAKLDCRLAVSISNGSVLWFHC